MRTSEQMALADLLREFLHEVTDLDAGRNGTPSTALEAAAPLGVSDILKDGDGTLIEVGIVSEELGRAASGIPLAESIVASELIGKHFPDAVGRWLPSVWGAEGNLEPYACDTAGYILIDRELGTARLAAAAECRLHPRRVLDLTRQFVTVGAPLGIPSPSVAIDVERVLDQRAVIAMCDAVGAAQRLLELTVEHALSREQFGSVIGGFQAVKHHCANMRSDLASARSAAEHAAEDLAIGAAGASRAVAAAALHCASATTSIASTALQIHGGMGFTWEHDLHLYLRRIKTDELMLGGPVGLRRRLSGLL